MQSESAERPGFNLRAHQTTAAWQEARTAAVVLTTAARHEPTGRYPSGSNLSYPAVGSVAASARRILSGTNPVVDRWGGTQEQFHDGPDQSLERELSHTNPMTAARTLTAVSIARSQQTRMMGDWFQAPSPFREHARRPREDSWKIMSARTERRYRRRRSPGCERRHKLEQRKPQNCAEGSWAAMRTFGFADEWRTFRWRRTWGLNTGG